MSYLIRMATTEEDARNIEKLFKIKGDDVAEIIYPGLDEFMSEEWNFIAKRRVHGKGMDDIHAMVGVMPGGVKALTKKQAIKVAKDFFDIKLDFMGKQKKYPVILAAM